jgi:hypothetical protein
MKRRIKTMALLAAMSFATAIMAAPKEGRPPGGPGGDHKGPPPGPHGKVESTTSTTIVVKDREDNETTITVDANTKYMLDGKAATLADVKAGEFVNAMPETGTATDVQIHTKPPRPPKDGKRGPGGGGPPGGGHGDGGGRAPGGGGPGGGSGPAKQ